MTPYFNSSNSASGGSALSYIPEKAWNLTASQNHLEASGGGASIYFAKPAWQQGDGVPNDGFRDVPDVAFFAGDSGLNDSTGYIICTEGDCASGPIDIMTSGGVVGGTSAATPLFSGILTLLNNYLVSTNAVSSPGLGNINPNLYLLANNTSNIFHQITQGDNIVPCTSGTPDCTTGSFGYSAGPGYNQVTGLGSVDAYNLVHTWDAYPITGTTTVLTTSEKTIVYGTPITLTATVAPATGTTTPTGSVTFYTYAGQINTLTVLGTTQIDNTGKASWSLPSGLAEDVSALQVAYSGDAQFAGSMSPSTAVYQPTGTTLSPSATQIVLGGSVTLTASISGVFANTGGTVTFYSGTSQIGTASVSNGQAIITTSSLPAGSDSLTAVYSGTTYFASSTSAAVVVTVSAQAAATTTSLTSSAAQASQGSSVTLTATVLSANGTPTGTVNFNNGASQIGIATLTNGIGTMSISSLPVGNNSITATYQGAALFASSTSSAVTVTILQLGFTLSATPATLSVAGGTAATTTLTINPVNGFNSSLNFSCSGLPSGSTCTFGTPAAQSNGTSTVSLSISTRALSAAATKPAATSNPLALALLPFLGIFALMKRRKRLAAVLQLGIAALAIAAITFGAAGCGSGGTQKTTPTAPTPVTSTVTVTAVAASGVSQNIQLTLTVN